MYDVTLLKEQCKPSRMYNDVNLLEWQRKPNNTEKSATSIWGCNLSQYIVAGDALR